jgi:chaperonin GroEL
MTPASICTTKREVSLNVRALRDRLLLRRIQEAETRIAGNASLEGSNRRGTSKTVHGQVLRIQRSYEDLAQAGVIDPTKVAHAAAVNASSIASLMMTEALIAEMPEKRRRLVQHPT